MLRVEGSQVLEFVWGNRTSVILYELRHLFEIMEKSFAVQSTLSILIGDVLFSVEIEGRPLVAMQPLPL